MPSNAKGNLSVYISKNEDSKGKLYKSLRLKKGCASISLEGLKEGHYYAHVIYTGKDYKIKSQDNDILVENNVISPESMSYGENKYLVVKFHKKDKRTFTLEARGKVYGKIKLVNGVGKCSLKKLPIGRSFLYVVHGNTCVNSVLIDVLPLAGKNVIMHYGSGDKYSVKVYDKNGKSSGKGKTVIFKIADKSYKVKTNKKGIASLKITAKPGKYNIITSYKQFELSNKIVVKHVLKLKTVKVKKSAKKLVLKASLKQGKKVLKSKKVTFKFNGKKYAVKTNKKGVAKVTIKKDILKKLKAGKKLTYAATYGKDTVKKTVRIKK